MASCPDIKGVSELANCGGWSGGGSQSLCKLDAMPANFKLSSVDCLACQKSNVTAMLKIVGFLALMSR